MARKKLLSHSTNMYKVLKFLSDNPVPHTVMDIANALGFKRFSVSTALKELSGLNAVLNIGVGIWAWSGDRKHLDSAVPERTLAERILPLFKTYETLTNKDMCKILNATKSGVDTGLRTLMAEGKLIRTQIRVPGNFVWLYSVGEITGEIQTPSMLPRQPKAKEPKKSIKIAHNITRHCLANHSRWAHDTVGCTVPLAKGFSGLEKI